MSLRVGVLSLLFIGVSAFAHPHHGHHKHHGFDVNGDYTGHGGWKSTDGTKGKFDITSTVKTDKGSVTVTENLVVHLPDGTDKKMTEEWVATNLKNGFFDVQVKGKKVGSGYCGVDQCHMQADDSGETSEETFTFHRGNVYRIGSHATKDMTIAWQGVSTKKVAPKK